MQTLRARSASSGFTLIELMVVVLLIGLALGVGLTLDFSNSPQRLEQQTQQVANITGLLAQEAVLSGAILALDFFTDVRNGTKTSGIRWLRQEEETWVAADIGEIGEQQEILFASDIEVQLEVEGSVIDPEQKIALETTLNARDQNFHPELLFLPSREITPFVLGLGGDGNIVSTVSADIMGRVRVNEDAPAPQ